MKWYLKVLKHYADFKGRASRTEYWMFVLFNFIFLIVLKYIDMTILGVDVSPGNFGLLSGLYYLFIFVPFFAVAVRRLHDVGKSGWFVLIGLIPIIGWIWIIILLATDGNQVDNQYGPNPKGVAFY